MKILLFFVILLAVAASAKEYKVAVQFLNPCDSLNQYEGNDLAWWHYDSKSCNDQMNDVFWADVMSLDSCPSHRVKRVANWFKEAGVEAIKVVSNLLDSKSVSADYDTRFQDLEQNVNEFKKNFSITHSILEDFMDYLQSISPATKSHRAVLEQIVGKTSLNRFGVTRVHGAILSCAADIEAIRDKCMEGKMATAEVGELANNQTISSIDPQSTIFVGVKIFKEERKVIFAFETKAMKMEAELNWFQKAQTPTVMAIETVIFGPLEVACGVYYARKLYASCVARWGRRRGCQDHPTNEPAATVSTPVRIEMPNSGFSAKEVNDVNEDAKNGARKIVETKKEVECENDLTEL